MARCCKECHIYTRLNHLGLCHSCHTVDEQLISLSRELLSEKGSMSVFDLAEYIGIQADRIFRWIEEGRISSAYFKHACPLCGKDMINRACLCLGETSLGKNQNSIFPVRHKEKFHSTSRVSKRIQRYWDRESRIVRNQRRSMWLRT